eukprot:11584736-Alexandrium_andersonii.AAC.1
MSWPHSVSARRIIALMFLLLSIVDPAARTRSRKKAGEGQLFNVDLEPSSIGIKDLEANYKVHPGSVNCSVAASGLQHASGGAG